MKRLFSALVLGLAVVAAAPAQAQSPTSAQAVAPAPAAHATSIAQLMSAEEVAATGIQSLEPEQLAALSAWLQGYEVAVARRIYESAEEEFVPPSAVIETQIDGSFDGWVGDTVFRLKNGQIWQQVSPSAKYFTAQSPRVTITRTPYLLHVDGVAIDIEVQRIK